ncbi:MAG: hypothetical protein WBG46_09410 [Nonlabens sp.]
MSFYIIPTNNKNFTRSVKPLETDKVESLVSNLLLEFEQSSDEEKKKYGPILKDWFSSFDEEQLFQEDEKKVRDFIYEMF